MRAIGRLSGQPGEDLEEMPESGQARFGSYYEVAVFGEQLGEVRAHSARRERIGT